MARSDAEVIKKLRELYAENFGGKEKQRFLISWADIRSLYGYKKLYESRIVRLAELATSSGIYIWDLGEGENGHFVAVIKIRTVDRWRKIPRKIIVAHMPPPSDEDGDDTEDDDL